MTRGTCELTLVLETGSAVRVEKTSETKSKRNLLLGPRQTRLVGFRKKEEAMYELS
jgi:hypothetical protein